ncbi:MarR family transcriptional regulator [Corynebacterium breve]|uniref:MarR family transcriptional regulator n=1 Tax=Corynebacterium breve TaxID=3049799 RepID=A0ABY8VI63_9CORY|nr:MarR family transcriptional regulator [Corynebacterium breve]WIM67250.1 MarR family transcriptional regulator [Corynebacterium breve]
MTENMNTWLTEEENKTWENVWSFYVGLPSKLDAQLKRDAGISHFDYYAMAQISETEEGSLRMSELAQAADMSLSHLSRVITRLEKKGLVKRVPDPNDGRSTLAELTPEGWEVVRKAAPGHVSEVRRLVFDNLTPEETRAISSAMAKIVNVMNPEHAA